ncbi:RHS repeat-associated core domain-containing protein, partial [Leptobacterium sp. I13]|uniref:RHS repeat domain-containing protein n=1 Tax=Leptobacterium meishanense TaxID=3128904 RepID=UPI0030EEF921
AIYNNSTLTEHAIYGSGRLGIYFRQSGSSVYQLTDHLGNVRAVVSSGGLTNATDYYPGGMPMPNRQLTDGTYRYGYQGDFAETDPETGKPAFEARLYDPRINRWLTIDPAGEFFSPYLAMGNNWINIIDPDGRCTTCPDDANTGDTYNHPDHGALTFDGANWLDAGGNIALDGFTGTQYTNGPLDQMGFSGTKIAPAITELSGFPHFMAELGENTFGRSAVPVGIGNIHYNIDDQGLATHIVPQGGIGAIGLIGGAVTVTVPQKAIVIGEGMSAVRSSAKGLQAQGVNAKWYQAWSKNFPKNRPMTAAELEAAIARNTRWIHSKIKDGYKIYDIGPKAKAIRSPFYQAEKDVISRLNYPVQKLPR